MDKRQQVIKQRMLRTRAALAGKIGKLTQRVDEGVQGATNVVETVQNAFDVPAQVRRYPWAAVAGSVAAGFLSSRLLDRLSPPAAPAVPWAGPSFAPAAERPAEPPRRPEPGWLDGVKQMFAGEIAKAKGLAIGAAAGVVRDLVTQAVPDSLKAQVTEAVNGLTVKLGGEPVHGPVFPDLFREEAPPPDARDPEYYRRPLGAGRA